MKKLLPLLALILFLTACRSKSTNGSSDVSENVSGGDTPIGGNLSDSNDTADAGNVKEITGNYNADFELCKNTEYVNLDWTDTGKCPVYPVSELFNIKCNDAMANEEMPQKEMLMRFEEYCNFYFGEYIDDHAFFKQESDKGEEILPLLPAIYIDGIPYADFYKITDYRKKLEDEVIKLNFLAYRNIEKNQYLWWVWNCYPHWINKGGTLTILDDSNIRCSSWIPSDMGEPMARYYNDGKSDDVKYQLADGEVSVGEAIKYFTEEYPKTLPYEVKTAYSVNYVDVYELGSGTYGYLLHTAMLFDSVAFEQLGEFISDSNVSYYYTNNGQALMIGKDDIDVSFDCTPGTKVEKDSAPITNIVSLKEAVDIVSEKMSKYVKFKVISTEFVYHGVIDSEGVAHLKPTWEFKLYNENDGMYYNTYVDAATGAFSVFNYNT